MKKLFILMLLVFLGTGWGFSQTIQLIMSPNPSPYFSDWQNKTETARLIVNNPTKEAIACKIKTQLFNGNGEMVGETDFYKMPVLSLEPGISQFNAEDIYPFDAIKLYGNSLSSMLKTGKIPEDNYRLCTDLVDPVKGTPLTRLSPQCKTFRIVDYQAPVLIVPREDQIILEKETKGIFFRWTPVAPSPNYIVTYRLQVWEVLEGQTNVDAVRYNWPIIEKDLRGILQTQWPIDFAPPEEGMNIVWTITPLDPEERNLVDGYGMADPFGFRFIVKDYVAPIPSIIVKLQQPPPYQLRMTDLSNFTLNNPTEKPIEVSLECKMTTQETQPILIIVILLKPFTLPPGTTTFTYDDIKNGDIKFESDEWRDIFERTGGVPAGDYEICVSVLDKEGKEIGKDCVEQKIESSACDDYIVQLMDYKKIYTGDSGGVEPSITNRYRGTAPEFRAKSFRIKLSNDLLIVKADEAPKGWKRTPSKFPPGSSSITWTYISGDIPLGETKFGSIVFIDVKSEPISVQYEWLNKDGKVICSGIRYDVSNAGTVQTIALISPKNGETIMSEKEIIFSWLAPVPVPPGIACRLKIVEIKGDESPEEAMQNIDSFFDVFTDLSITGGEMMYKYPESAPKFEAGKKYAWAIQSVKKKDYDWDEAVGDLKVVVGKSDSWVFTPILIRNPEPFNDPKLIGSFIVSKSNKSDQVIFKEFVNSNTNNTETLIGKFIIEKDTKSDKVIFKNK